jgi:hypothetical protein
MANKVYLYQDVYLYPGTYDRYTNLSELYGRSGIYFEAKREYNEYITNGPYNYTDRIYVPSSYTEMDTTSWVDMELESNMEFSSCSLSGYDKNGNYLADYFYEGTKVSIYCLEEDSPEESPDLDPDEPIEEKTSFNACMEAIAKEIKIKASIPQSEKIGIVRMIELLNGLHTSGIPNYDDYDNTDFESCMIKLSKVIRS